MSTVASEAIGTGKSGSAFVSAAIELAPVLQDSLAGSRLDYDAFQAGVGAYGKRLLSDLGLEGVGLALEMRVASDGPVGLCRIALNGRPCRQRRLDLGQRVPSLVDVVAYVNRVIYDNRALIFEPPVVDHVRQQLRPPLRELSEETLAGILHNLARLGVSIDRLRDTPGPDQSAYSDKEIESFIAAAHGRAVAIEILVGDTLVSADNDAGSALSNRVAEIIASVRESLFAELGIILPRLTVRNDPALGTSQFCFRINDLRLPGLQGISQGEILVRGADQPAASAPSLQDPLTGLEWPIVSADLADQFQASGMHIYDPAEVIGYRLAEEMRRHASALLSRDLVQFRLRLTAAASPRLAKAIEEQVQLFLLKGILSGLLEESVSIRDLRSIFEAILSIDGPAQIPVGDYVPLLPGTGGSAPLVGSDIEGAYIASVRMALKRQISAQYSRPDQTLYALILDEDLEKGVLSLEDQSDGKGTGTLLLERIADAAHEIGFRSPTVMVADFETRRRLRSVMDIEFPWLPVLCREELMPDIRVMSKTIFA